MRFLALPILAIGILTSSSAAFAGPNVALCVGIENNYNNCRRDEERRRHFEHEREREEWEEGRIFRQDWERYERWRERHGDPCAAWVYELKANGCF